jgi:hypothetical protein
VFRGEGFDLAEPGENLGRRVLHVCPPSQGSAKDITGAIADAGCAEVPCPDVYRALARLGGGSAGQFHAVVVCVDRLEASELEFFRLVGRHYPDVDVYVYGQPHTQTKADSAVESGAEAVVRADALAAVLCPAVASQPAAFRADEAPQPQPVQEVEPEVASTAPAADVPEPPVGTAAAEEEPPAEPASKPTKNRTTGARVPWLQYDDMPQRTPPNRTAPKPARPASPQPEPDQPLLSPEELDALIGDGDGDGNDSADGGRKRRRPL